MVEVCAHSEQTVVKCTHNTTPTRSAVDAHVLCDLCGLHWYEELLVIDDENCRHEEYTEIEPQHYKCVACGMLITIGEIDE